MKGEKKGWKGEMRGDITILKGGAAVNEVCVDLLEVLSIPFLEGLVEEECQHPLDRSI